jgi:hypothetical protein
MPAWSAARLLRKFPSSPIYQHAGEMELPTLEFHRWHCSWCRSHCWIVVYHRSKFQTSHGLVGSDYLSNGPSVLELAAVGNVAHDWSAYCSGFARVWVSRRWTARMCRYSRNLLGI